MPIKYSAKLNSDPATQGDVSRLEARIGELRAELKTSLHTLENRLIRWMVGLQVAMGSFLVAAQLMR